MSSNLFQDREYISRYSTHKTGLTLYFTSVPTDSEITVVVDMLQSETDAVLHAAMPTDHVGQGTYEITLGEPDTNTKDEYDLRWYFQLDGTPMTTRTFLTVDDPAPAYDALDDGMQEVVNRVWIRFADIFDSLHGGPNLQQYFQTHFGRNRIAQLLDFGLGRLNTVAQPHQTYTLGPEGQFPLDQWGPLLETATYVETIKHLIRSYVEQPEWPGANFVRADRRDYQQRWESILAGEEADLAKQLESFKIASMNLGRPAVLVAGGAYGMYGPTRLVGSALSRPRYWTRFYS